MLGWRVTTLLFSKYRKEKKAHYSLECYLPVLIELATIVSSVEFCCTARNPKVPGSSPDFGIFFFLFSPFFLFFFSSLFLLFLSSFFLFLLFISFLFSHFSSTYIVSFLLLSFNSTFLFLPFFLFHSLGFDFPFSFPSFILFFIILFCSNP